MAITLETVCRHSPDIVAREIGDEIIIIPLIAGIGDADDELYSLNASGRAIWQESMEKRTWPVSWRC